VFKDPSRLALWLSLSTAVAVPALGQQTKPDNTAVNKGSRAGAAPTADQQKNDRTDVSITRDIRRAIVNDKALSSYAHNVKVITSHGDVTLKGPVRTEEERKVVESKAAEIAGAGHVTNQLSIVSPRSTRRAAKSKA